MNYNLGAWLRWRNLHPRLPLHQIFLWCLRLNLSRIHAYRFQLRCSYLMLLGFPAVKRSYTRPSIQSTAVTSNLIYPMTFIISQTISYPHLSDLHASNNLRTVIIIHDDLQQVTLHRATGQSLNVLVRTDELASLLITNYQQNLGFNHIIITDELFYLDNFFLISQLSRSSLLITLQCIELYGFPAIHGVHYPD